MKPKGQGKKGTAKDALAGLARGDRAEAAPRSRAAGEKGRGRPKKYADDEKPQRVGVYLDADLLAWLYAEVARRKIERRDASASEIVADALTQYRKRGDR